MAVAESLDTYPTVLVGLLWIAVVVLVGLVLILWVPRRSGRPWSVLWRLSILGGITFAAFVIAAVTSWFYAASWPLVISLLVTGFVVTSYGVVILAVRQYWIVRPSDQLWSVVSAVITPSGGVRIPSPPAVQELGWSDPGYPTVQYYVRRREWERAIARAVSPDELRAVASAALALASDAKALETSRGVLQKQAVLAAPSEVLVRHHARQVVAQSIDQAIAKVFLVQRVQNQLTIFALVLLAAVTAFSAHGWAAPMVMGAVAACVFRVRQAIPEGTSSQGGGPRWMAMLLTPLIGAVAAVIGLVVVKALEGKVFTAGLVGPLNIPQWDVHAGQHRFSMGALAIAVALGWSAKLLDTLLSRLTTQVEQTTAPTAAAGPPPDPDPNSPAVSTPRTDETVELARRVADAESRSRTARTDLVAERVGAQSRLRSLDLEPDSAELFAPDTPVRAQVDRYLRVDASEPTTEEIYDATAIAAALELAGQAAGVKKGGKGQRLLDVAQHLNMAAAAADHALATQAQAQALRTAASSQQAPTTSSQQAPTTEAAEAGTAVPPVEGKEPAKVEEEDR